MKTVGTLFTFLVLTILLFAGLALLGIFDIGIALGITPPCFTPLCSNYSQLFGDLCPRCQSVVDGVQGLFR